ncbi:BnaA08g01850D [Brassica napus]|uniref:Serine/threonine-protein phosphatase 2A 55 kDa regulatory subunit B n=1 Tax=Brassica napus TaxID=3708 RepID=A0A078I9Q5_BRANA|nr:BnaA08g01850D [Brassica napus]
MNGEVVAASADPSPPLEWRFSQVFGERSAGEEVHEVDVISAIQFDNSGDHLATGDRGGRVVLFERTDAKNSSGGARRDLEEADYPLRHPKVRYKTEFQSHDPEFDYLKSLEIEEKINKIRWCQTANGALFLLSTNDKTIKFWKVSTSFLFGLLTVSTWSLILIVIGFFLSIITYKKICDINSDPSRTAGNVNGEVPEANSSSLRLPVVVTSHESSPVARCRRVYSHAHDYHINSISNNSDGETFVSADNLRTNLWNLEITNQSFNIVDVKPEKMEDLSGKPWFMLFFPSIKQLNHV